MRSTVLCWVDAAKGNCPWGNWQLSAAVQILAETAAAEIKAKLNDFCMTAGLSEILEWSNKVLMDRNDTSNTVKDAAVATDTFLCVLHTC